jgi:hypothetical protein
MMARLMSVIMPGLAVGKLSSCPTDENEAAVNKNDGSEGGRNEAGAGEGGRCVSKPVFDVG